jgi:hypothetical protein
MEALHANLAETASVFRRTMVAVGNEDRRTGKHEKTKTGGEEDRRTEEQEDRKIVGQNDKRIGGLVVTITGRMDWRF